MSQTRHNLPAFLTSFIGRADEIADLSQLLDDPNCRLLTLTGPGGIGKTRLAIEATRCKLDAFPNGVYFIPLQPLQAADQVVPAIIDALPLQVTGDPTQQLLDYLHDKCLLLLLDNFEHVLASASLVNHILADAPLVTMLITSREMLRLRGEWVRTIAGLTYPDSGSPADNDRFSALDLFAESARRLRGDFVLDDEYAHVVRICQLVEGMPLGIELAAGWTTALTCAEIASEIEHGLDFLTSEARDQPERHRSMQAVFDHSWRLLTEDERFIMRRFAVFRGGGAREAAEQITSATLKTLAGLVAKSMLRHDPASGRYDVQELLRQYAYERLVNAGDSEAAHDAHCHYYADFMGERAPDVKGRGQLEGLNEIEADWNNVRVAWGWALAHRDWACVGQMMETMHLFCEMHTKYADGDALFQAAVAALEPGAGEQPHPLWGELLVRAAEVLTLHESDEYSDRIMALLDRAEQEAHMGDDPLYLWVRGRMIFIMRGEPNPDPLPLLEASLAGFRARDDHYYMARALRMLAFTSRGLSVQPGSEYVEKFIDYTQQYLDLTRDIGDETGLAHALFYQGMRAMDATYLWDDAARYYHEADIIWQKMGDWKSVAVVRYWLGFFAYRRGDFERARPLLEDAARLASEVNFPGIRHSALVRLSAMACIEGDYVTGQQLLAGLSPDKLPWSGDFVAACGQGDFQLVREYLGSALRWFTTHPPYEAEAVGVLPMAALLLAHEGEREWAVELLARQASEREIPIGYFDHWALLDETRADLERQLGAAAFDAAWQRGETLDVEAVTRQLLAYLGEESTTSREQANQALDEPLTERELEVLGLLAEGLTNRQIAEALVIAPGTVKRYVYDICQKLDADNRTHAVSRARELGVLP